MDRHYLLSVFDLNEDLYFAITLFMVAAPPKFRWGDLKISNQNNWGGGGGGEGASEQKI